MIPLQRSISSTKECKLAVRCTSTTISNRASYKRSFCYHKLMSEKLIIITGASDGIGAAAARSLKARGERVVLVGHTEQKTKLIAHELISTYYIADFARLD